MTVEGPQEDLIRRWRTFAGEVESRLQAEEWNPANFLLATLRDVLGRWVAGECSIDEATQTAIAARTLSQQLARFEDQRVRENTALHEAGHAIVACALGVRLVEVRSSAEMGMRHPGEVTTDLASTAERDRYEFLLVVACAGREALAIANRSSEGCGDDEDAIRRTVLMIRPLMGQMEALAFVAYCRCRAAETLRHNWQAVERLAAALLERNTIPGPEAEEIIFSAVPALRPAQDVEAVAA